MTTLTDRPTTTENLKQAPEWQTIPGDRRGCLGAHLDRPEPHRESCGLLPLRGWSHVKQVEAVSAGAERTSGSDGVRTPRRVSVAMERDLHDRREARRASRVAADLGSPSRDRRRPTARSRTTNEHERLKQLERENRELKRANEILKSVSREPAPTAPASPGFCTATKWQWSRSPAATVKYDAATASPIRSTRSPPPFCPVRQSNHSRRSRELATWKPYGR